MKGTIELIHIFGAPTARERGHAMAHALLEYACCEVTGRPAPAILRSDTGKPFFLRSPLQFSLTHTRTMVFCALATSAVGIDAETIRPIRKSLVKRTMNPEEADWLAAQEDFDRAFLTLWTMKEAWVKLTGEGLNGRPKGIILTWCDGVPTVMGRQVYFETRETDGVLATTCSLNKECTRWLLLPSVPCGGGGDLCPGI